MRHAVTLLFLLLLTRHAEAQSGLLDTNDSTSVERISFSFLDADRYPARFDTKTLQQQMATKAPGFVARLKRRLGLKTSDRFILNPVELQKDVVRLRTLYQQEGYLRPDLDYGGSVLNTAKNTVHLRFSVEQGAPIIIQDVGFYSGRGYLAQVFEEGIRQRWIDFRDRTSFQTGDRFTTFQVTRIQDQVLSWLKDRGYAFPTMHTETEIDSTYNTADISFVVDPGPVGTIDTITIEGNRRVRDHVIRRELPFKEGDIFSHHRILEGQRELFGLNLFQIVQADIPEQPRDSSVSVHITLRESKPRYIAAETGYDLKEGLNVEAQWSHRNFLGAARIFSVRAEAQSGLFALSDFGVEPRRLFRASLTLNQPYLFINGLQGVIEPFLQYERDPLLRDTPTYLDLNRREFGVSSSLIYEFFTFRTASLRYSLGRATQFADERTNAGDTRDVYSKETITLSSTLGWIDNFLHPERGLIVRPSFEYGGPSRLLGSSDLQYLKMGFEILGYIPLTHNVQIGLRLSAGRLWPLEDSKNPVLLYAAGDTEARSYTPLFVAPFENRFDPVQFYAGGSHDVRGWGFGLIGPKINRTAFVRDDDGNIEFDGDSPMTHTNQYEAIGGMARLTANAEVRLPFPGLSNAWRAALFVDAGQVSAREQQAVTCPETFSRDSAHTQLVDVQCGFQDTGNLTWDNFRVGTGAGIRYETAIGYVRLDLAVKLNPDELDLQTPRGAFLVSQGMADPERSFFQRLNIHVSLGQAF